MQFLIRQSNKQHLFKLQIYSYKMDHDLLESISKALQKLHQEQTILSNKLIKITEVCKNKFIKVEREQIEKRATHDTKFNTLIEEIEGLKKEEVRLADDVTHLETEHKHVANKISFIDETLEEMKAEIEALKKPVDTTEKADSRKQCKL